MKILRAVLALCISVLGVVGLSSLAGAQPIPNCGGDGNIHTVPEGGYARCQGARVLQDGLLWSVVVEVRDTGEFGARFTRPVATTTDIFVELEAHKGGSGAGEVGVLTGFLPAGQTQVTLSGTFNPAGLMPFDCVTQTDAKAINGNKDKPTPPNMNRVRIAGGWFQFENCSPPETTTTTAPTTAPTSVPNSAPSTGPATTTVGSTALTTRVLPATGPGPVATFLVVAIMAGAVGLVLLTVRRVRSA